MDEDELIIAKMKECGWTETADGKVTHYNGMAFDGWRDALFACIEVASEQ